MINAIEEYSIDKDEWNTITINGNIQWTPVEVAGCILIQEEKILIFGGSDYSIKDCRTTYVFDAVNRILY